MSRFHKLSKTNITFPIDTTVLIDLWKQFINNTCLDFDDDITEGIQEFLCLQIIKEGIIQGIIRGDEQTAYKRYRLESSCFVLEEHRIHFSDNTVIPLNDVFIQSICKPTQIQLYNEYEKNRKRLTENIAGYEFTTIRIADFLKKNATTIDFETYQRYLTEDFKETKVFTIEGEYYAIGDFDTVFIYKGQYITDGELEIEKAEFEKVLNCTLDEVAQFMNSEYATVQFIIKERFSEGR